MRSLTNYDVHVHSHLQDYSQELRVKTDTKSKVELDIKAVTLIDFWKHFRMATFQACT